VLEETSFHLYPRGRHLAVLVLAAIAENWAIASSRPTGGSSG